jgi:hypothetical protein
MAAILDAVDGMIGGTREYLAQVRFRAEAVEFCCSD